MGALSPESALVITISHSAYFGIAGSSLTLYFSTLPTPLSEEKPIRAKPEEGFQVILPFLKSESAVFSVYTQLSVYSVYT